MCSQVVINVFSPFAVIARSRIVVGDSFRNSLSFVSLQVSFVGLF